MRKLLLGAILLFSTLCFSQIQKVEIAKPLKETRVAPMGQFWIGADIYDDGALITFQDFNFTKIIVLRSFRLSLEDFNSLGVILTSDNKIDDFYSIKTLDSKILYLKFGKSFGVIYPLIILNEGVKDAKFPNLTKSQIKKLFDIK